MKIELKPIKYNVEIPEYGKFEISPLGAGAEAEIRILARKFDEVAERIKEFDDLVQKEANGEEIDRNSEEWKNAVAVYAEAGEIADEMRDTYYAKLRKAIKGEKVDKLFEDFTYDQLVGLYKQVVKGKNG